MSKTEIVNKIIDKKQKRKPTKVKKFIDTLARTKFPDKIYESIQDRYLIVDNFYDAVQEPWFDAEIEELYNKATEQNILDSLKKNKKFKEAFENSLMEIAKEISDCIGETHKNVINDRKVQEETAKRRAKLEEAQRIAQEKIAREQKKRAFELTMLKESLNKKQLQDLKKFYGVDISTIPSLSK